MGCLRLAKRDKYGSVLLDRGELFDSELILLDVPLQRVDLSLVGSDLSGRLVHLFLDLHHLSCCWCVPHAGMTAGPCLH